MNEKLLYVSQISGNDDFAGTRNKPFKSLEKALDKAREEKGVNIVLLDDYFLSSPLIISVNGVKITSFSKAKIVGGRKITGWQEDEFNGLKCRSAPLPKDENGDYYAFTDLFVNGKRAESPRYPENGLLRCVYTQGDVERAKGEIERVDHSSWFIANKDDLEAVDDIEDGIINYFHYWIDEHSPIESYDKKSGKLTMAYPSLFAISNHYDGVWAHTGMRYFLSNVAVGFNKPNQWYLDKKSSKVYYLGKVDEAFFPTLSSLIKITADGVIVDGVEFAYCKCDYASVGKDGAVYAADPQSVCSAHGAISFENAKDCSIENCYIHSVGVHGLEIGNGCCGITIKNNRIEDVAAGGIIISGGAKADPISSYTHDCVITGNEIANCSKRYYAGCGILSRHAFSIEISHNEIHDIGYSGISCGWVWGYGENVSYDNRITHNHIYNIGSQYLSDMGGIYTIGIQNGTIISHNTIHNVRCANYGAWGIYLDEGSSYILVENNTVFDTGTESFMIHYGKENSVRNNTFIGGEQACVNLVRREEHRQAFFENNRLLMDGSSILASRSYNCEGVFYGKNNIVYDKKQFPVIKKRDGKIYYFGEDCPFFFDEGSKVENID